MKIEFQYVSSGHPLAAQAESILKNHPAFAALESVGVVGVKGATIGVDETHQMVRIVFPRVIGTDTTAGFVVNLASGKVRFMEIAMMRCLDGQVRLVLLRDGTAQLIEAGAEEKGEFMDCYRDCIKDCHGDPYCKINCAYGCIGTGDDDN